jgi:hypothetical protein
MRPSSLATTRRELTLVTSEGDTSQDGDMTTWEYLIVALPGFEAPTHAPGASAAVHALNDEGERGWEAVGMTPLADGRIAVLLKRPRPE